MSPRRRPDGEKPLSALRTCPQCMGILDPDEGHYVEKWGFEWKQKWPQSSKRLRRWHKGCLQRHLASGLDKTLAGVYKKHGGKGLPDFSKFETAREAFDAQAQEDWEWCLKWADEQIKERYILVKGLKPKPVEGGNPMAKRKLVIPAIMRRFSGHTYYEYIGNVAKKTAESEARKAKGAGLLTRVVPTGSKWTVYTRAPENPSKKRRVAKAAGIATPTVLAVLFLAGLIYLGKTAKVESGT